MKNLMIFINPSKSFGRRTEDSVTVKIQIDNSLDLGWDRKDLLLVTNFDYEYNGVKSIVIDDDTFFPHDKNSTKFSTLPRIFEKGLIEDGQMYWCHDLDAFQAEVITEEEIGLDGLDAAFAGRAIPGTCRWSGGIVFFKKSARDIFEKVKKYMDENKIDEESALQVLTTTGEIAQNRYKRLNQTYNLIKEKLVWSYPRAEKPLKVLHFHPGVVSCGLDVFMHGKNELGLVLMPERLIKIFNAHGIK